MISPTRYRVVDRLAVEIHPDRRSLGRAAARSVAATLHGIIAERGSARVVFACAPSQDEFLAALTEPSAFSSMIDWSRVTAFHMDDYVGLRGDDPRSFRKYLQSHLLSKVPIGRFHPLMAENDDASAVCAEYAERLAEGPIDLICLGIGENGHIAFNDPGVAEFDDASLVKVVDLDLACRQQQVHDGCFPTLEEVPKQAFTLTIPVFRQARRLSIHVPGSRKAAAVRSLLEGPISSDCPATILRVHPNACLYLDADAAAPLVMRPCA